MKHYGQWLWHISPGQTLPLQSFAASRKDVDDPNSSPVSQYASDIHEPTFCKIITALTIRGLRYKVGLNLLAFYSSHETLCSEFFQIRKIHTYAIVSETVRRLISILSSLSSLIFVAKRLLIETQSITSINAWRHVRTILEKK